MKSGWFSSNRDAYRCQTPGRAILDGLFASFVAPDDLEHWREICRNADRSHRIGAVYVSIRSKPGDGGTLQAFLQEDKTRIGRAVEETFCPPTVPTLQGH